MNTSTDKALSTNGLNKRLHLLQCETAQVQALVIQTNEKEYQNISAIYLWWRAASTVAGYLDEAYKATYSRRVNQDGSDGISFKRLLYLMYGNYGIDKDSLDRKNRVLNHLHKEYEKNDNLYAKDGVNKLAGYIKTQGGVNGLIESSSQDLNNTANQSSVSSTTNTQSSASNKNILRSANSFQNRVVSNITDEQRQSALQNEAALFFSKHVSTHQVSISPPIATNKEGYGLALVKRTASGYSVLGATDSASSIRELMVSAYRKQFAALPLATRCLFELIKTQTLTLNTQKLYDKLAEVSLDKHEDKTKKKITRRVMYLSKQNILVLSPTYSKSGVVTLAKLKHVLFEGGANDCFLPPRCRKLIEQRLLSTNDFNLFAPSNDSVIPRFERTGLASHLLRLDNKADAGDFIFVEFWQFEKQMDKACEQLFYVPSAAVDKIGKFSLPQTDVQTLATEHIDKWLASYGDHLTRPANALFKLSINQDGFVLGFDYVNGKFRNHASCNFTTKQAGKFDYSATFLSKDLCLALHSIGDLQVQGDIELTCTSQAFILSYSTDVADYTIAVPTTTGTKRNEYAFTVYTASATDVVDVDVLQDHSHDDDVLFDQALAKSNTTLTDDEIEKMLGLQVDDYAEILEGWIDTEDLEDDGVEQTGQAQ
jgi:hypothetical protein